MVSKTITVNKYNPLIMVRAPWPIPWPIPKTLKYKPPFYRFSVPYLQGLRYSLSNPPCIIYVRGL